MLDTMFLSASCSGGRIQRGCESHVQRGLSSAARRMARGPQGKADKVTGQGHARTCAAGTSTMGLFSVLREGPGQRRGRRGRGEPEAVSQYKGPRAAGAAMAGAAMAVAPALRNALGDERVALSVAHVVEVDDEAGAAGGNHLVDLLPVDAGVGLRRFRRKGGAAGGGSGG